MTSVATVLRRGAPTRPLVHEAFTELVATAFLLIAVVGSGIMAKRLCGGNVGLALLAKAKAGDAELPAGRTSPSRAAQQAQKIRCRGVEPWHQPHWNWKAAGNFLCGGTGTGLFAVAAVAGLDGGSVAVPVLIALALIAFGLFLLIFKIGRPLRSIYVLRQPQRSWMSREAWVAAIFFPLTLLAVWSEDSGLLGIAAVLGLCSSIAKA